MLKNKNISSNEIMHIEINNDNEIKNNAGNLKIFDTEYCA